ncbi:flagellar biosynthetic protein FliO [candidate division GN15 bacterium]|nr:flagellar biosynthetic protein FliO [candidate division GN15 bacterium]
MIFTVAIILVVALCGLVMIGSSGVEAEGTTNSLAEVKANAGNGGANVASGSPFGALFKMIAALVIVIACIYGGLYLLNRQMKRRQFGKAGGTLDVIETAFVGPKKTVSLVRIADRAVLVGVTDNQITVLTELSEPETARILAEQQQPSQEAFGTVLHTAFDRMKKLRERGREALARA